ncbi:MAG: GNAT family N-acetyltransferase [Nitrospirae bacterium]|nr:GNAT family N-acetyltransferase [Nitrospirota bacterium]
MGKGFGREDFPILTAQQEIITGLFAELEKKVKWDIASFTRLGPQSNEILNEISSGQSRKYEVIDMQNPVIEIKGTYEDYFNSRSKNFRANYRKKSRRINEWGKIFFEHADARDLSCILEKIRSIGVESWQGEKGVHLAANEKGNKFLEAMADNFSRRGVLDVSFLYLNEEPIAYLSGARFKKTYFAIETGYKEKYFDVSPGMLLHLNVLERLYGYGDVELMDLGYDAPYKRRWTDTNRPEKQIVIYNKRIYPQLVCAFRKSSLYPRVLAVRDRFVSGKVKTEGFSKRATEKRS